MHRLENTLLTSHVVVDWVQSTLPWAGVWNVVRAIIGCLTRYGCIVDIVTISIATLKFTTFVSLTLRSEFNCYYFTQAIFRHLGPEGVKKSQKVNECNAALITLKSY